MKFKLSVLQDLAQDQRKDKEDYSDIWALLQEVHFYK